MRLSSSSLEIASARISCSERSANRFTMPSCHSTIGSDRYIRLVLNKKEACGAKRHAASEWQDALRAATAGFVKQADALLLALLPRADAGGARAGARPREPRVPDPAHLHTGLAAARRRRRGGRDADRGVEARAQGGGQYRAHRSACAPRGVLPSDLFGARSHHD